MTAQMIGVLIPIFGILCGIVAIISGAHLKSQKLKLEMMREQGRTSASDAEMVREIQKLKDRVAVLERIATDDDKKLAGEIERLRRSEERI